MIIVELKFSLSVLVLSMVLGILVVLCFISTGMMERLLIIGITLLIVYFLKNARKYTIKIWIILFVGLVVGTQIVSYSLNLVNIEKQESYDNLNPSAEIAILLIYPGEPQHYDLIETVGIIKRRIPLIKAFSFPFHLLRNKIAYEKMGISRYNEISKKIRDQLSLDLDQGYDVYMAYYYTQPDYKSFLNEVFEEKAYKKIIIAPVYLSESKEYLEMVREIEIQNSSRREIQIKYVSPLWESEKITKGILHQINEMNMTQNKTDLGIVLTDLRMNDNIQKYDLNARNQERVFMERIKLLLVEGGYEERKIKLSDFHDTSKALAEPIAELQQYGVSNIYIIGINDIWCFINENYKVQRIINKMKDKYDLKLFYVEGWGLEKWVVEELEFRIRFLNVQGWND